MCSACTSRWAKTVLMPAVRAHMVLAALTDHGEILASSPPPDGVEQFQGREIDAWIASDHEDEAIAADVRAVSEVFTVEVDEAPAPGVSTLRSRRRSRDRRPGTRAVARCDARRRRRKPAIAEVAPPAPKPAAEAGRSADQDHPDADRPRRRRAPRRADALDGRARDPSHRGRGADREPRGRGPPACRSGADPQLAGAPGDGHAGPHDPGRRRLPALPAADPRPLDQARQGGRSSSWSAARPSSTGPSSTRSAIRSSTSSATPSITAWSGPMTASPPASRARARSRSPRATPAAAS